MEANTYKQINKGLNTVHCTQHHRANYQHQLPRQEKDEWTGQWRTATRNVEDALCKTNSAELYIGTGYAASKNSQSLVSITVQA